jgi:hypothetical protein
VQLLLLWFVTGAGDNRPVLPPCFITLSLLGVLDFALKQFQAFWFIFENHELFLRYIELLKLASGHPSV